MGTLNEDLAECKRVEDTLTSNKVSRFAYTQRAYADDNANGVETYNFDNEQNIPLGTPEVMKVNTTVVDKGYRAQASSITRMLMNHFLGRISYNLNKINDVMSNLLSTIQSHLGTANGVATLDENGRIPFSQLPESALEYKGNWDASTNTPHLANGTGTKGDFYICTVAGTVDFGAGDTVFLEGDRALYDGSVWTKLSAGEVRTVNGVVPVNGDVTLTFNKSDVGLGNVENVALSNWSGSSNLTQCSQGTFGNGAKATFSLSGTTLTINLN